MARTCIVAKRIAGLMGSSGGYVIIDAAVVRITFRQLNVTRAITAGCQVATGITFANIVVVGIATSIEV